MKYWTLTYNGVEKSLSAWGLDDLVGTFGHATPDTVDMRLGGRRVDAAILFAYGAKVVIKRDRTGSGSSFSGGSIYFTGWVRNLSMLARPRSHSHQCSLVGPWWYLKKSYEQQYQNWTGYTTPGDPRTSPTFETVTHSRVFLNQTTDMATYPTGQINTGLQIKDALNWVLKPFVDAGATPPFQVGTVDVAVNAPIEDVKAITCEQVTQKELRWSPSAVVWFDYTTVIPTLHCRDYANLTTFNLDKRVLKPTSLDIKPRYDRQCSFVRISYELNNDINGTQFTNIVERVYPDPVPAGVETQFNGVTFPIDLRGATRRTTQAPLVCEAINLLSTDWWLRHDKSYAAAVADGRIEQFVLVGNPTIETDDGAADLGLPREVTQGTPAEWMTVNQIPIATQRLKISQKVRIKYKAKGAGAIVPELHDKTFSVDLNSTNAVTGLYTEGEAATAEQIPDGLERQLYDSLSRLPWEGSFELTENEVGDGPGLGTKLNILGGRAEWATMGAVVQSYTESIKGGRTSVQFGWPDYLNAGDLVDLLRVARNLSHQNSVSMRSGRNAGGGRIGLAKSTDRQSAVNGAGTYKAQVFSEVADGTGGRIAFTGIGASGLPEFVIEKVGATGVRDATKGAIELPLNKTLGKKVELLQVQFTDGTGATKFTVLPLAAPYTPAVAGIAPIVIAGGGSSIQKFIITSIPVDSNGDPTFLICAQYNATGIVANGVEVALPHDLRPAAKPAAYMAIRKLYAGGATIMAAQPVGGTDDGARTWIDLNIAGRRWSTAIPVCISGANTTLYFASQP